MSKMEGDSSSLIRERENLLCKVRLSSDSDTVLGKELRIPYYPRN